MLEPLLTVGENTGTPGLVDTGTTPGFNRYQGRDDSLPQRTTVVEVFSGMATTSVNRIHAAHFVREDARRALECHDWGCSSSNASLRFSMHPYYG
jgi:hypothetical protein